MASIDFIVAIIWNRSTRAITRSQRQDFASDSARHKSASCQGSIGLSATLIGPPAKRRFPAFAGAESADKATALHSLSKEASAAITNSSINRLHDFRPFGKGSNCGDDRPQGAAAVV